MHFFSNLVSHEFPLVCHAVTDFISPFFQSLFCSVYHTKSWNLVHSFTGHNAVATDLDFGPDASFLVSSSMDRSVKFWGKASA